MSFLSNLKPSNGKHSIKEAVISLFLANPIIKPERFGKLIEESFIEKFQRYEPVKSFQFHVKNEGGNFENSQVLVNNNAGFKFTRFSKGKTSTILQSRNEEERTFISYHIFSYERWAPFLSDFREVIEGLSNGQSNLFVTAFSLHYIDEFIWDNPAVPVPVLEIFNSESGLLPKEFFKSTVNQYQLTTQKEVEDFVYFDRLEIKNNSSPINSSIFISHNITQAIDDVQELAYLIKSPHFCAMVQNAHEHNKDILKSVLTKEVQGHIGLQ